MVEASDPIPKHLAEAFADAVSAYESWHPTHQGREILISGRGYFPIADVCDMVSSFMEDQLPEHVLGTLLSRMHDQPHGHLKVKLRDNPAYGIAAICLHEMMDDLHRNGLSS
jgi:hypothetical protein